MKFETDKGLARFVAARGGTLWLVGGAVRDQLRGVEPHDRDYMVTGVDPGTLPLDGGVGRAFQVFRVAVGGVQCEVAMARRERRTGKGHCGFTCDTAAVSVQEDLSRRDLTINAMAINVLSGGHVDPFGGGKDLAAGVLRHTTPAFAEDPLRVLRVARFAAALGFSVEPSTIGMMRSMVPELPTLPGERVWGELLKALDTPTPSAFFSILWTAGAMGALFPEMVALDVPDMHDGTAYEHTMKVMDAGTDAMERFGLLVHDFGKSQTPAADHPKHHKHEKLGGPVVKEFCRRLRIPRKYREFGVLCCTEHMRLKTIKEMRHGKFFKLVLRLGNMFDDVLGVSFVDSAFRAGTSGPDAYPWFAEASHRASVVRSVAATVTGKSLIDEGREPGSALGELLLQRRIKAYRKALRT